MTPTLARWVNGLWLRRGERDLATSRGLGLGRAVPDGQIYHGLTGSAVKLGNHHRRNGPYVNVENKGCQKRWQVGGPLPIGQSRQDIKVKDHFIGKDRLKLSRPRKSSLPRDAEISFPKG